MSRIVIELDDKKARWLYIFHNFIWVWLGLASLSSGVRYFISPEAAGAQESAANLALSGPLDEAWNITIALGGLLIVLGVLSMRHRTELLGHLFFTAGVFTNAAAVAILISVSYSFLILIGAGLGSMGRAAWLWWSIKKTVEESKLSNAELMDAGRALWDDDGEDDT